MIEHHVELARALADPNRLRILALLAASDREVCVCELMEILDLPQSRVSRHLQHLRRLRLVRDRREGQWVHYRLDTDVPGARELVELVRAWARNCGELAADRKRMQRSPGRGAPASCARSGRRATTGARKGSAR